MDSVKQISTNDDKLKILTSELQSLEKTLISYTKIDPLYPVTFNKEEVKATTNMFSIYYNRVNATSTASGIQEAKKQILNKIKNINEALHSFSPQDSATSDIKKGIHDWIFNLQTLEKSSYIGLRSLSHPFAKDKEAASQIQSAASELNQEVKKALDQILLSTLDNPSILPDKKKSFDNLLNVKTLGHLVGDSFLKEMQSVTGIGLEGNSSVSSEEFLLAALEYIPLKYSDKFSPDSRLKFDRVAQKLKQTKLIDTQISELIKKASEGVNIEKDFLKLSSSVTEIVKNLKEGDSFVLPWGWIGSKGGGHAVLAEFTKKELSIEIRVFNTGGGVNFHDQGDKSTQVDTIKKYSLSPMDMDKDHIIQKMLETKIVPQIPSLDIDVEVEAKDLYYILADYEVASSHHDHQWMKKQLSGTCSLRSLMAMVFFKIGGNDYKVFKDLFEIEAIEGSLNKVESSDVGSKKIISRALPNLFRHFLKPHISKEISSVHRVQELKKIYESKFPSPSTQNQPLSTDLPKDLSAVSHVNSPYPDQPLISDSQNYKINFSSLYYPPKVLDPLFNITALSDNLKLIKAVLENGRNIEEGVYNFFIDIGRLFIHPDYKKLKIEFLKNSSSDVIIIQDILNDYETIVQELARKTTEFKINQFVGFLSVLPVIFTFGKIVDDIEKVKGPLRIDSYSFTLDETIIKEYINGLLPTVLNIDLENDVKNIVNYFAEVRKDSEPEIFNIRDNYEVHYKHDYSHIGCFIEGSGDYKYIESYDNFFKNEFKKGELKNVWEDVDKLYKFYKSKFPTGELTQDSFRIYYLISRRYNGYKLPQRYFNIRNTNEIIQRFFISKGATPYFGNLVNEYEQVSTTMMMFSFNSDSFYNKPLWSQSGLSDVDKLTLSPVTKQLAKEKLTPIVQNEVILKKDSLSSERGTIISRNTPLCIPMLLDFYIQHKNLLIKPEEKLYFRSVLFQSNNLDEALKANPQLAFEYLAFFDQITKYVTEEIPFKGIKSDAISFVIDQKQRLISHMRTLNYQEGEKLIQNIRVEILTLLKHPDYSNPMVKTQLLLSYLESYVADKKLNRDQVYSLLQALLAYKKNNELKDDDHSLLKYNQISVSSVLHKHLPSIRSALVPGTEHTFFAPFFQEFGLNPEPNMQWSGDFFPVYIAKSPQGTFELDVSTGTLFRNGIELSFKKLPSSITDTKAYKKIFKDENFQAFYNGNYFEAKDTISPLAFKSIPQLVYPVICRKWENDWYEYKHRRSSSEDKIIPIGYQKLPHFRDYLYWHNTNTNSNKALRLQIQAKLQNSITKEIDYILYKDGSIYFAKQNRRYEVLDVSENNVAGMKGIFNLDKNTLLLRDMATKQITMLCPNLEDKQGPAIFDLVTTKNQTTQWVYRNNPHLKIAKDQRLDNLQGFNKFLVLENDKGQQFALIPRFIYQEIVEVIQENQKVTIKRIIPELPYSLFTLKDHKIDAQNSTAANLYSSFLQATYANTSDDYIHLLETLKSTKEYRRYSDVELALFGQLYLSFGDKRDNTPESAALKIYILSLVKDNLNRYPSLYKKDDKKFVPTDPTPGSLDDPQKWSAFWDYVSQGDFLTTLTSQVMIHKDMLKTFSLYFETENNLPTELRLEHTIDATLLNHWKLDIFKSVNTIKTDKVNVLDTIQPLYLGETNHPIMNTYFKFYFNRGLVDEVPPIMSIKEALQNLPVFRTRIKDDKNNKQFQALFSLASSRNPQHNRIVINYLRDLRMQIKDYKSPLFLLYLVVYETQNKKRLTEKEFPDFLKGIDETFKNKSPSLSQNENQQVDLKAEMENPKDISLSLPDKPSPIDLKYQANTKLFSEINSFYRTSFAPGTPRKMDAEKPFQLKGNVSVYIKDAVDKLNEDYFIGRKNNQAYKNIKLIKSKEETLANIQEFKAKLNSTFATDKNNLRIKKNTIEHYANYLENLNPDSIALVESKKKNKLSLDDCILLFLHRNTEEYVKSGIPRNRVDELYKLTGEYLELSIKMNQTQKVLEEITLVEKYASKPEDSKKLDEQIINFANVTKQTHLLDNTSNAEALLVFESRLGVTLRDYQVAGLNDLLHHPDNDLCQYEDLFLQRIQAGGKTFVWGHLLAHLKADGYHLSVHVSPSHQYASNLYSMGDKSKYAFNQSENTLIFDDSPAYFTTEYLTNTIMNMKRAIVNKEYLNTTKKSLDTLLARYDELALRVEETVNPEMKKPLNDELNLLEEIRTLLRTRGIFTFDEAHQSFEPNESLNIPFGQPIHPDYLQSQLISKVLRLAVLSKTAQNKTLLRLKENQQSQQTNDQKEQMKEYITVHLINDPEWQKVFGIREGDNFNAKRKDEIGLFLLNPDKDLPRFLDEEKLKPENINKLVAADHVLLAKQLLAGGWLEQALSKSVNEFHGISRRPGDLPVSIPFVANMVAAYGSEFSDQFVKIINTKIAYLVEGITKEQTVEFVDFFKRNVLIEYQACSLENLDFNVKDTESMKVFHNFCDKNKLQLSLFDIDTNDEKTLLAIQSALRGSSDESMQALLNYVIFNIISKIVIYLNQVSITGQDTAAMAKYINGYTASIDNPNMAPIMDSRGRAVKIQPQPGTNGQTIDLLLNKNNEVWVIPSKPESIFTHLINQLPEVDRKNVRAIIDEGCHFRGVSSHNVAKMILGHLPNQDIKGVLFYDQVTKKLSFIHKDKPYTILPIEKGTIKEITGLDSHELFTYYDQDHITGSDIPQMDDAVAISTMSENSRLPNELQQVRRMRKLDYFQKIITSIQEGSLDKIGALLNDREIKTLKVGKVMSPDFIKELLLFSYINEKTKQQTDNLEFCIQKMETLLKQYLRDEISAKNLNRSDVYRLAKNLFKKDISINLYRDYAKKKKDMDTVNYLTLIRANLMANVKDLVTPEEFKRLDEELSKIAVNALKGVVEKVKVHPALGVDKDVKIKEGNPQGTVVQQSVQQEASTNVNVDVDTDISKDALNNPNLEPRVEAINYEEILGEPSYRLSDFGADLFDKEVILTENYLYSDTSKSNKELNIHKPVMQYALIYSKTRKSWKVCIGSLLDMDLLGQYFIKNKGDAFYLTIDQKMDRYNGWIVRLNGNLAMPGTDPYDKAAVLADKKARFLMVQALLVSGNLQELNSPAWREPLKEWLGTKNAEQKVRIKKYFESDVLMGKKPAYYLKSTFFQLLNTL